MYRMIMNTMISCKWLHYTEVRIVVEFVVNGYIVLQFG